MNIMKRLVTLFVMVCGMHAMIAQTDVVDNAAISVATSDRQMTAELVALYEEAERWRTQEPLLKLKLTDWLLRLLGKP